MWQAKYLGINQFIELISYWLLTLPFFNILTYKYYSIYMSFLLQYIFHPSSVSSVYYLSIHLSSYSPSIYLWLYPSILTHAHTSSNLFIYEYLINLSIYPPINQLTHLSVYLAFLPSIRHNSPPTTWANKHLKSYQHYITRLASTRFNGNLVVRLVIA